MSTFQLTRHAQARQQQRCIPPLIVEWLLAYGKRLPSHGAIKVRFDKQARKQLCSDVGKQAVSHLAKYLNAAIVIDPISECVITVEWLH